MTTIIIIITISIPDTNIPFQVVIPFLAAERNIFYDWAELHTGGGMSWILLLL